MLPFYPQKMIKIMSFCGTVFRKLQWRLFEGRENGTHDEGERRSRRQRLRFELHILA